MTLAARARRARRLLALLAQHPTHRYRERVRRGLDLRWLDDFAAYWNSPGVKPVGLPITDYASYQALRYHYAARFREAQPDGDAWDNPDQQYARLLSYVHRREMHPLRWLPAAWHLRHCETVLEYGAGAAPYAHGVTTAWPLRQFVMVADIPGRLLDYCRWRFRDEPSVQVVTIRPTTGIACDGIVCTEVFEHLPDPMNVARGMTRAASVICFDYVDNQSDERRLTLKWFNAAGTLTGPDARGLYVWRRDRLP